MRKLLMIPGPIEFDSDVLKAMSEPSLSHVSKEFIDIFADSLEMMKKLWMCPGGQAFIMAGTGTLAMDMAGANMLEKNDKVLVISTGYFGERYAELLDRYGADYRIIRAAPGETVQPDKIEDELRKGKYKIMTFTHVDTSTAVKTDAEAIGRLGQKYDVISILDGVCSVGGEEIRQKEWGIDIVLTASQKAIGVPPGLALMVASEKAMKVFETRRTKVQNYYADWANWLPVMQAYESRKPAYFGTPAVNLVAALNISLKQILEEGAGRRFARHEITGRAFRSAFKALGISQVPADAVAANTLSAPYYPGGIRAADLLAAVNRAGVVLAGGLHPDFKNEYFRIGHMGRITSSEAVRTVTALEEGLKECGYDFDEGAGIKAAKGVFDKVG